ncbi:response regulator [Zymobacter palmae]|uniref:Response regulators consisting of a CheY-like n=1 Tax=Zymobacter palmae TaxID=33074 RepID=A0A348HG00_9GAMM|nr:response regulator [Zymobacter palmae]BBG30552.1 response regulators consisting of a CheY-like [Zymobacter palmae]
MSHILIVEDEPKIAELIADYLHSNSYTTTHIDHGDQVLPWLEDNRPDLVLLDVMLPGMDGLALCREIRQRSEHIGIIMLTARVEEIDRLLGLEIGADDYICKPFSPREVLARTKALLRRISQITPPDAEDDASCPLVLDHTGWRALANGKDLGLTAIEFQLLSVMMQTPGRIYSREQLMEQMYRDHRIVSERTVDSHIKKLRKKIADVWPDRDIIHSVYGVGYKYSPDE